MNKTKIICTLGPASCDEVIMSDMLNAGMNVARINFSHGDYSSHEKTISTFRKVRDELSKPAAVMLDTKGPEIRIKTFKNDRVAVKSGQSFTFTTKNILGDEQRVSVTYENLPGEMQPRDIILVDDGLLKFVVKAVKGTEIICEALNDGDMSNNKGVNIPDKSLSMEYMSDKDKNDVIFGIKMDVDYIAASFVRRADDVNQLKNFIKDNGGENIKVIAKIENMEGIENFEEILDVADGIMIARGDMGVEVEYEKLPGIQKHFIKRAKETGKIVITATQMLESMIENPIPTRAEITDIANAVFEGTSAVMLSGESAVGKYPVESVNAMSRIIAQSEKDLWQFGENKNLVMEYDHKDITNAVGHGACTMARDINAKAIIAITKSGYTASKMSKYRPNVKIIGSTPHKKAYHQMSMFWGVLPMLTNHYDDTDKLFKHNVELALENSLLKKGDLIVISMGYPLDVSGNTNMIKVERI